MGFEYIRTQQDLKYYASVYALINISVFCGVFIVIFSLNFFLFFQNLFADGSALKVFCHSLYIAIVAGFVGVIHAAPVSLFIALPINVFLLGRGVKNILSYIAPAVCVINVWALLSMVGISAWHFSKGN